MAYNEELDIKVYSSVKELAFALDVKPTSIYNLMRNDKGGWFELKGTAFKRMSVICNS